MTLLSPDRPPDNRTTFDDVLQQVRQLRDSKEEEERKDEFEACLAQLQLQRETDLAYRNEEMNEKLLVQQQLHQQRQDKMLEMLFAQQQEAKEEREEALKLMERERVRQDAQQQEAKKEREEALKLMERERERQTVLVEQLQRALASAMSQWGAPTPTLQRNAPTPPRNALPNFTLPQLFSSSSSSNNDDGGNIDGDDVNNNNNNNNNIVHLTPPNPNNNIGHLTPPNPSSIFSSSSKVLELSTRISASESQSFQRLKILWRRVAYDAYKNRTNNYKANFAHLTTLFESDPNKELIAPLLELCPEFLVILSFVLENRFGFRAREVDWRSSMKDWALPESSRVGCSLSLFLRKRKTADAAVDADSAAASRSSE